jgi:hypothetical protein
LSSVVPAASVKPSPAPVADTPPAVVAKSSVAPKVAALSIEQVIENTKSSVASSRGAVLTASAQNSPAPQAAAATAAPASLPPPPAIAPTPQPALAAAAPAPAAKTSAPAQAGKTIIQLASVPDEAQAKTTLESLQHKYAVQLGGVSLHLARADLGTRSIFFRIQSQGLAEQDANRICSSLKQINAGCFLVRK